MLDAGAAAEHDHQPRHRRRRDRPGAGRRRRGGARAAGAGREAPAGHGDALGAYANVDKAARAAGLVRPVQPGDGVDSACAGRPSAGDAGLRMTGLPSARPIDRTDAERRRPSGSRGRRDVGIPTDGVEQWPGRDHRRRLRGLARGAGGRSGRDGAADAGVPASGPPGRRRVRREPACTSWPTVDDWCFPWSAGGCRRVVAGRLSRRLRPRQPARDRRPAAGRRTGRGRRSARRRPSIRIGGGHHTAAHGPPGGGRGRSRTHAGSRWSTSASAGTRYYATVDRTSGRACARPNGTESRSSATAPAG